MDLRQYWNFNDPAGSESRFRELLETDLDPETRLIVLTQIARTLGLRKMYAEAHAVLDEVDPQLQPTQTRAVAYAHLERGRTLRSSGDVEASRPHFEAASTCPNDELRVDAIHMLAIIASDPEESERLNRQALAESHASDDPGAQRWVGSLSNNLGWSLHDQGRYEEALEIFRIAEGFRNKGTDELSKRIASWCVARCLRSLGRLDEALAIQRRLESGEADGYVNEEIGEILLAQGKTDEAKSYFSKAAEQLEGEVEPERLARLRELGQ